MGVAKFQGKLTCDLKNYIKNLINFHSSSRKSKDLHFDQILLSKAYKYSDEKVQKSYVSWHWGVMHSLKKNWLLVSKMTWGIWWILMRAAASLKICNLMCCSIWWVISHGTEKRSKLWSKNDFLFEKWHEQFGEI